MGYSRIASKRTKDNRFAAVKSRCGRRRRLYKGLMGRERGTSEKKRNEREREDVADARKGEERSKRGGKLPRNI